MRVIWIAVLCASCELASASPADRHTARLEARIAELEKQLAAREEAKFDRTMGFDNCVAQADDDYWNYVHMNGWRKRGTRDVWQAPMTIWNQAAADKRNAIEICKATWKKGD